VRTHHFSISLILLVAMACATDAAAQTPVDPVSRVLAAKFAQTPQGGPPQDLPTLPDEPDRPFWTARRINILGGFSAAAAAGVVAWRREMDLRARKRELQSLSSGSNDEFARKLADAEHVMKDRNFWGAVAGGVGGVTLIYLFTSGSPPIRTIPGGAVFVWSF
jgi:hypothetical protein